MGGGNKRKSSVLSGEKMGLFFLFFHLNVTEETQTFQQICRRIKLLKTPFVAAAATTTFSYTQKQTNLVYLFHVLFLICQNTFFSLSLSFSSNVTRRRKWKKSISLIIRNNNRDEDLIWPIYLFSWLLLFSKALAAFIFSGFPSLFPLHEKAWKIKYH